MLLNFIKVAFRNIWRHKVYSLINTIGLAIGMACCLFIYIYVSHELSYDKCYPDYDRIFRIVKENQYGEDIYRTSQTPYPLADTLRKFFPDVVASGRLTPFIPMFVKNETMKTAIYEKNCCFADQSILTVFSLHFLKGSYNETLISGNLIVITERMALKYFGNLNSINRTLIINDLKYCVKGIVSTPPLNTHWNYDIILPMKENFKINDWVKCSLYTYVKLIPNTNPAAFQEKIRYLSRSFLSPLLKSRESIFRFILQPVESIHLSHVVDKDKAHENAEEIKVFIIVGVLILLIACINFINLSSSLSMNRSVEAMIRRSIGSSKNLLIIQFLSESLIISFFSAVTAFVISELTFPLFRILTKLEFKASQIYDPNILLFMFFLVLFTGISSGLYPAYLIANQKPGSVLKYSWRVNSLKQILRKLLILIQFAISIILFIFFAHISNQLNFMKHKDLGIDKTQKLILRLPDQSNLSLERDYIETKSEFLKIPDVINCTASSNPFGDELDNFYTSGMYQKGLKNKCHSLYLFFVDPDFIPVYNIKILQGRTLNKSSINDRRRACLINEDAVKTFGWISPEQALGKIIYFWDQEGVDHQNTIIGVFKNFHFRGLKYPIEPTVMFWEPIYFKYITLNISSKHIENTLASVRTTWHKILPGYPIDCFFLEEFFDKQYELEERESLLFKIFAVLGQSIACLGLIGLASFLTHARTKEIGIRKALGESTIGVVFRLSKEFLSLVAFSNLIAWPLAYIAVTRWLSNFAYHIEISLWPFIISGALVFTLAALTVCFQTIKAASANPVKSLRYE